jgi:hypothetical protein
VKFSARELDLLVECLDRATSKPHQVMSFDHGGPVEVVHQLHGNDRAAGRELLFKLRRMSVEAEP